MNNLDRKAINTVRVISCEAIDKANSGHPGLPLGAAPIIYTLFSRHLKHNPKNPDFINRDRFILSAGHGSALLYSTLHLFGYDVNTMDLMNFRQLSSKTPGHPEYGHTAGIETTTGPLGQGVANAVGMAIAETVLADKFNTPEYNVIDHYTYALTGDGCMQEGIEYESASLAGTLKLGKLIVIYDKNNITIEGDINSTFSEDVGKRHEAQGWHVVTVEDGNDTDSIDAALTIAKQEKARPSLVIVKTQIGYGSSLAGTAACHGSPLGSEKTAALKSFLQINSKPFEVANDVKDYMSKQADAFIGYEEEWKKQYRAYKKANPELAEEYEKWLKGKMANISELERIEFSKPDATRSTSYTVLNKLAELMPNLIGGSADLAPSNKSDMKNREYYSVENRSGTNFHFGIREHAMAAITNGLQLHGGLQAYCSTFFVFTDYMKNAMRLAALMEIPVTYILTHDSIGVGEDGATHQPVEQLIGLRSIPNLKVFRPACGKETIAAWQSAMSGKEPTALVLSRQNLPQYDIEISDALKGGYILSNSKNEIPDAILIATGSEVEVAVKAQAALCEKGVDVRVVSMPCIELFEKQQPKYRDTVLPRAVRNRVAIEAGSSYSWYKYIGLDGVAVTMDNFGASAPADRLFEIYGFSVENVVEKTLTMIKKNKKKLGDVPAGEEQE